MANGFWRRSLANRSLRCRTRPRSSTASPLKPTPHIRLSVYPSAVYTASLLFLPPGRESRFFSNEPKSSKPIPFPLRTKISKRTYHRTTPWYSICWIKPTEPLDTPIVQLALGCVQIVLTPTLEELIELT